MANNLQEFKNEVSSNVLSEIGDMKNQGLKFPEGYNPTNAINSAWLQLQDMKVNNRPALQMLTPASIQKTFVDMVTQGLTPAKNQIYLIPYGNELSGQRSYFGTQTVLKRLPEVNDIWANVIYDGDIFEMEIDDRGRERLQEHKTSFLNRDNPIIGAYAIVDTKDDGQLLTVMTKKEIDASWSQARTNKVQNKFPAEMAKRTVINRAAKNIINTSSEDEQMISAINRMTEQEHDPDERKVVDAVVVEDKEQDILAGFNPSESPEPEPKEEAQPDERTRKIGERIKQIRKESGLNQEEFAQIAGTNKSVVSQWENFKSVPNDAQNAKISEFVNSQEEVGAVEMVKEAPEEAYPINELTQEEIEELATETFGSQEEHIEQEELSLWKEDNNA